MYFLPGSNSDICILSTTCVKCTSRHFALIRDKSYKVPLQKICGLPCQNQTKLIKEVRYEGY